MSLSKLQIRLVAFALCFSLVFTSVFAPIRSKALVPALPGVAVAAYNVVKWPAMIYSVLKNIEVAGNAFESIFGAPVYEFWKENFTDEDSYRDFTSSLDYTTVDNKGLFEFYPTGFYLDGSSEYISSSAISSTPGRYAIEGYALSSIPHSTFWGAAVSAEFDLPLGVYNLYLDYGSGIPSTYGFSSGLYQGIMLQGYYDGEWVELVSASTSSSKYPVKTSFSTVDYSSSGITKYRLLGRLYHYGGTVSPGTVLSGERQFHIECLSLVDSASILADSTTRPISVMDVITKWNKDNSIATNPININYYISPTGQDVTSDNLSNPSLYNEETLVFTDPVTGNQYLTSGWTYDYLTRCYTLDMADTFTIGESVIDTIKLTYGDEKLTINHYSNGSLVQSDSYDYVMVSGSECGLNGHSYTYETIKQESCTSTGERKYTCSVCGDEYAETVPATEHPFTYTVAKPATCLSTGMGIYTCPDCGLQSTETIPKSGHSSVVVEVVPSEYDENGALISAGYTLYECTECGSQYTESEDVGVENESWFSWLGSLFKNLLSSIVNGFAAGLEWVIEEVLVTTVGWIIKAVEWVYGLFNGEHLTTLFNWFSFEHEAWTNEFSDSEFFEEVA